MKSASLSERGWTIVAAASEDPSKAARFIVTDPEGHARLLDVRERIVYPPQKLERRSADLWTTEGIPSLSDLDVDVTVFDSEGDLANHLVERRRTTSLGAGRRSPEPTADATKSWTRRNNPLLHDPDTPTFATLAKHAKAARAQVHAPTSINVIVYVSDDVLPLVRKWVDPKPRTRFFEFSRSVLGRSDRIRLVPTSQTHEECERIVTASSKSTRLGRRNGPKVTVLDPAKDRYYRSGFADVVCFTGHEPPHLLPNDLWTTRANALLVQGRSVDAPHLLTRIKPFRNSGAVLLGDVRSNRLWQQFTDQPRFSDLVTCLRGLHAELDKQLVSEDQVQRELGRFLDSVFVADLDQSQTAVLRGLLDADPHLSGLDLPTGRG